MDRSKTSICLMGAIALVAVASPAEAKTKISVSGAVDVSTDQAGVEAKTLLAPDAAKAAVESKLQWAEACGDVEKDASYKVALTFDGNGAVTAIERLETTLPDAIAACIDGVLKEVRTAALPTPESKVKAIVALELKAESSEAAATAVAPVAATVAPATPAGEPPVSPPATPSAPGENPPEAPAHAEGGAVTSATSNLNDGEPKDGRAWGVLAQLSTSVGAGTFIKDANARAPYFGYALTLRGSYKVTELITASLRLDMQQELTQSNTTPESSIPREFLFGETRLGASTHGLFKEEYTGIEADVGTSIRLPTDLAGRASGRIFGWVFGGYLKRTFKELGPGDLELSYNLSYRENFGPRAANLKNLEGTSYNHCRSPDDCPGPANTARSLTNNLVVAYTFLENFTATLDVAVRNDFRWALNDGDVSAIGNAVTSSPFANRGVNQSDLVFSTIELGYQINEMFAVAAGVSTIADPFIKNADGPGYSLRFPLFDFKDTAYNTSAYYLSFSFTY